MITFLVISIALSLLAIVRTAVIQVTTDRRLSTLEANQAVMARQLPGVHYRQVELKTNRTA